MIHRARVAAAVALLLPGLALTYAGLVLCLLSSVVEPDGSEE